MCNLKKILFVGICIAGLFSGCDIKSNTQEVTKTFSNQKDISEKLSRIEYTESKKINGYSVMIITDSKTGREFLVFNGKSIIEITPEGK